MKKIKEAAKVIKKSNAAGNMLIPKAEFAYNGYESATISRDRSYIFSPSEDAINNPGEFTRHEITRMTRYVVANYPLAERIMSLAEIYGVGNGLVPNAATNDPQFNKAATSTFSNWADATFCTNDNEYTLWQAQRVIAREILIAGEVFIVLVKTQDGYPQIMLVPSERVRDKGDGKSFEGIYYDSYGKAIAYNIFAADNVTSQKVDASNVIHLKKAKNIGQLRGIGAFCSSLNSLRDEKDCITLIKRALKYQLAVAAFWKKKNPALNTGGGLGGGLIPVDPQTQMPTTGATDQALDRIFGGHVIVGQEGEELELVGGQHPAENITNFLDRLTRDVCLSVSLPFDFVVSAEKLNGTAMRFVINDAAFFFSSLQNLIIESAMQRIYGWVIASFIKAGKLQAPDGDILPYDASYTKPISLTVDQGRVSTAELQLVNANLMTREAYYSARGRDWKQEADQSLSELSYFIEQAKLRGIPLELVVPQAQLAPKAQVANAEQGIAEEDEEEPVKPKAKTKKSA